jgi:2-polyprenyl-6-methoxyphenol hydroxylase-like FAD-dependent oxidoreductase
MTLTISLPMVLYASGPRSQRAFHPSDNMLAAANDGKQNYEQVHRCRLQHLRHVLFPRFPFSLHDALPHLERSHYTIALPDGQQLHHKHTVLAGRALQCTVAFASLKD